MATTGDDVAWLLDVMDEVAAAPIIAGGWGVDALAGRATRAHRDLDVVIDVSRLEALLAALHAAGWVTTTDWLPVRIELSDPERDRHVDVHPGYDDGEGGRWQHGLDGTRYLYPPASITTGFIGGRPVQCLTAEKQRAVHLGYELRDVDRHDLAVLASLDRG